jgi:hypothetical protein
MKTLIIIPLLFCALSVSGRSKPVDGLSAYLIGQPHPDSVFISTVPVGERAVYSMTETPGGNVICGTRVVRGKTPWLFLFDAKKKIIKKKHTWPVSRYLKGQKCVSALVTAANGRIYGATSNLMDIDYKAEADVIKSYAGSHLFRVKPYDRKLGFKRLGIPFKGEGVMAMVAGKKGKIIYGITAPSQIFFSLNTATGKARKLFKLPGVELELNRYIGKSTRALVTDKAGNVYGSYFGGRIFRWNVKKKTMDTLETELPTNGGTSYDGITALTRTKDGRIFGGTLLDGKLFELLPKTGKIVDLGTTSRTGNVTGLVEKDGILYGLSGGKSSFTRIFAYNIKTGEYHVYPMLKVYFKNTPELHKKEMNQVKNLLLLKSGLIASGDDESNGLFYLWDPVKIEWNR